VDVDEKKISSGYYIVPINNDENSNNNGSSNNDCENQILQPRKKKKKGNKYNSSYSSIKVPIVHFSLLAKDDEKRHKLMNEWQNPNQLQFEKEEKGRITKTTSLNEENSSKRPKLSCDMETKESRSKTTQILQPRRKLHGLSKRDKEGVKMLDTLKDLPVVVCVAMYRSNGVLESNVASIGRKEGFDLWHFS